MLRATFFLIACLSSICLCSETKADLVLVLDTASETLSLTGSTSGVFSEDGVASWQLGNSSGGSSEALVFNFNDDITGGFFFSSTGLSLDVFVEAVNEPGTLTADTANNTFSFADFTDEEKTFLASQIGSSLNLVAGTDFENIRIVAAVPEPASAVVLCSALAALAIRRKRS